MTESRVTSYPLTQLADGAQLRSVVAAPLELGDRVVLQVRLTDQVTVDGVPDIDYIDMPTFVIIPQDFSLGTIEVEVCSGLLPGAPEYARAFAGIAYHVTDGGNRFEAVYLRPLNGARLNPPPPRQLRAVQYFAYPDWKFQRLRDTYPDGRYEGAADIGADEWVQLKLDVRDSALLATVNGVEVLNVTEPKVGPVAGAIGLFVDIGTRAFFSNLTVTST